MKRRGEADLAVVVFLFVVVLLIVGVPGCMFGYPKYKVWEQEKEGEAELAKATVNRRIKIEEAKAAEESSKALADAEVIRARGVAEANKIIGGSLEGNESYLRYLWIHSLAEGKAEVIYVPTEANLPILEASRRMERLEKAQ